MTMERSGIGSTSQPSCCAHRHTELIETDGSEHLQEFCIDCGRVIDAQAAYKTMDGRTVMRGQILPSDWGWESRARGDCGI